MSNKSAFETLSNSTPSSLKQVKRWLTQLPDPSMTDNVVHMPRHQLTELEEADDATVLEPCDSASQIGNIFRQRNFQSLLNAPVGSDVKPLPYSKWRQYMKKRPLKNTPISPQWRLTAKKNPSNEVLQNCNSNAAVDVYDFSLDHHHQPNGNLAINASTRTPLTTFNVRTPENFPHLNTKQPISKADNLIQTNKSKRSSRNLEQNLRLRSQKSAALEKTKDVQSVTSHVHEQCEIIPVKNMIQDRRSNRRKVDIHIPKSHIESMCRMYCSDLKLSNDVQFIDFIQAAGALYVQTTLNDAHQFAKSKNRTAIRSRDVVLAYKKQFGKQLHQKDVDSILMALEHWMKPFD